MDDLTYEIQRTVQGEAWWLGGQLAVAWSIICNIAKLEAQGVGHVAAVRLALKKYTGREEPGEIAKDIGELVRDPERFVRMAKKMGYHFDVEDPMPFAMGGRVDVNGKRREGDAVFYAPDHVDSVHLYRQYPIPFDRPGPASREMPATMEFDL